jgi:hypothetical protein
MCCESTNSFVRLIVWYRIPLRRSHPKECDKRGGHVTLQVKHGDDFVHLGWWPIYWDLKRADELEPNRFVEELKRARKKLWEWCLPHRGKKTRYSRKAEAKQQANPDDIDSIMVQSPRLDNGNPKASLEDIDEALPSAEYYLCVPDIKAVLDSAKAFNDSEPNYHVVFNNCASVIARALKKGGITFPLYFIMSPRILEEFCRKNLTCS